MIPELVASTDIPKVIPKPEIRTKKYNDLFSEIKKQNWQIAKSIAYDYGINNILTYVEWLDITRPGSKHSFSYLKNFLKKNPNWPKETEIKKKIELSISISTNSREVLEWYSTNEPITVKGSIDYLEHKLLSGFTQNNIQMIRDIWITKNLTYKQQRYFIKKYSRYWTNEDNWKRFDRLMWEGKTVSAKRTLLRIKGDYRKLGDARLALSSRAGNVSSLINKVPKYLKDDPGLIYERMRWRRKAKLETAEEFLLNPPQNIENYRNWWINARVVIRRLINKKKYNRAYKLLSNHSIPINTISGAEAEWLSGWVALTFLNKPEIAANHFGVLYNNVSHPSSKSKASFWLARAIESSNKPKENSRKWYTVSSNYDYSFYGQNASLKLGEFNIDSNEVIARRPDRCDHIFDIINFLLEAKESKRLFPFLKKALEIAETKEEKNFIYNIALELDNKNFLIKLVKNQSFNSINYSYPKINNRVPEKFYKKNDLALIHSIILQESAFKLDAYSHAGARGLMQLMPYTAQRVANSLKIKYYRKALRTNAEYNILLGTTYIKQLLKEFDNSIPLALAGYNGGPGRVRIWLKRYGDPRKNDIDYLDWIESIPISETRNYVKKVMANYRIYQKVYDVKEITGNFNFGK
ncbi:lytic transglycosylase domain-containing protein [Rickettsiales bacterium]|nr:lytic transglycosylase domain-containing protein [Rickettsiales bacterium]